MFCRKLSIFKPNCVQFPIAMIVSRLPKWITFTTATPQSPPVQIIPKQIYLTHRWYPTNLCHSGPESNDNKRVLRSSHRYRPVASPPDAVYISYPRQHFRKDLTPLQRLKSVYSRQVQPSCRNKRTFITIQFSLSVGDYVIVAKWLTCWTTISLWVRTPVVLLSSLSNWYSLKGMKPYPLTSSGLNCTSTVLEGFWH